jgi:hypothetical protein
MIGALEAGVLHGALPIKTRWCALSPIRVHLFDPLKPLSSPPSENGICHNGSLTATVTVPDVALFDRHSAFPRRRKPGKTRGDFCPFFCTWPVRSNSAD